MCIICPKCGAIAEYNAYYGRVTCTRCSWESEKTTREKSINFSKCKENNLDKRKIKETPVGV